MKKSDLQIVILEDLKFFWDDKDVRELYCDLMKIKFDGYGKVYGENVISSDKVDYFGTHLIVCKKGLRLKPIFSYKSVTLNKCNEFNLEFPASSLVNKDADQVCKDELQDILNEAKELGKSVSFDYSWAQDPQIMSDRSKETVEMFRDLAMLLAVKHHEDYKIDKMITCGVIKVKTDKFFEKMGLNKISNKSLFKQKDLNGDEVHIYHTEKYSDYAYQVCEKYKSLWDNRIEYSARLKKNLKLVA